MTGLVRDARFAVRLFSRATPGFLAMMGYGHPLALGRSFVDEEGTVGRERAVILTYRVWRDRFGGDPAIVGRQVRLDNEPYTVVGVLGEGPADHQQSKLWLPLAFTPEQLESDSHIVLLGAFAVVALLLAAAGIYGVMSFVVAQRTQEIGVRMALGAPRARVLREVLRDGMGAALIGTLFGAAGAWFLGQAMKGMIHGVQGFDPVAFAIVASTLLGSAVVACLVPARRAASVDPIVALRRD